MAERGNPLPPHGLLSVTVLLYASYHRNDITPRSVRETLFTRTMGKAVISDQGRSKRVDRGGQCPGAPRVLRALNQNYTTGLGDPLSVPCPWAPDDHATPVSPT